MNATVEQVPVALPLRPSLAAFAATMEAKLRANDYKGGWDRCTTAYLRRRIRAELRELMAALDRLRECRGDPRAVESEAADVANFAMMIADVTSRRARP